MTQRLESTAESGKRAAEAPTVMPTAPLAGLNARQAAERLAQDGPNLLEPEQRTSLSRSVLEVLREPMVQLLLAAGGIYLLLGDRSEALLLLSFVVVNLVISVAQSRRTERVLAALKALSSPRAQVWRDGRLSRISGAEVVQGDALLLSDGDRVAADARLVQAHDLLVDESLLTGESLPVSKQAGDSVLAGSMVLAGQGWAQVTATGPRSQFGRIGRSLVRQGPPVTPLQLQMRRLVRWFSVLGLFISALVAGLSWWARGDVLGALLAGITLAMSLLPQEFLLILTVFMAMGAWRLSRQQVLIRRAATLETLGSATVLCTDKTGTLTLNRMRVCALWRPGLDRPWRADGATADAPNSPERAWAPLLQQALLASEPEPFDPMERSLQDWARQLNDTEPAWALPLPRAEDLLHEYGLSATLPAMTHVWRGDAQGQQVAIKGAPEAVLGLCRLAPAQREAAQQQAAAMAGQGWRVLAVGQARWPHTIERGTQRDAPDRSAAPRPWPDTPAGFDFELMGLVAWADPLRPEVPEALARCREAGLRVLMITGDHPDTARAIARQSGLLSADAGPQAVITGAQIEALDDAALQAALRHCQVAARVAPAQKLRLVEALKAQGEVVAMTGDGVNDAPSLQAAHIGIAMGGRGSDVAREASAMVLLNDDFGSIVQALRLGRRIRDNLRKAMVFVLAVHVPIAGLSLLPVLMGWPLLLMPVHIAFLELLIDPICSIVFEAEPEEAGLMQRAPPAPGSALLGDGLLWLGLRQGLLVLVALLAWVLWLLPQGLAAEQWRLLAFVALVSANVGLILSLRSLNRLPCRRWPGVWLGGHPLLFAMLGLLMALMVLAVGVETAHAIWQFASAPVALLVPSALMGLLLLPLLEGFKPRSTDSLPGGKA